MNYNNILIDGDIIAYRSSAIVDNKNLDKSLLFIIIDNTIQKICKNLQCYEYTIYLGAPFGTQTFRHKLAKTAIYKGNRKIENRPKYLQESRDYLIKKYNAYSAINEEADDLLGIHQCESNSHSIIASIDKDLLMIPGLHYNILTKEILISTEPGEIHLIQQGKTKKLRGTGLLWFCAQMLLGDITDNIIKPVPKFGDVGIYKFLIGLTEKENWSILSIWQEISKIYEEANRDISENADLLWIQRELGKSWRDIIYE